MKPVSMLALSSLLLATAVDSPAQSAAIALRDVVPVMIQVDTFGSGEFPQMRGVLYVKNIGNSTVRYKGPDNCRPNPFDSARPLCNDTTHHLINGVWAYVEASRDITIAPGQVAALRFYSDTSDPSIAQCGKATVTFDVFRQFDQWRLSSLGAPSVYANDTAAVLTVLGENVICQPMP
jgi:hypothetical protein